MPLLRCPTGPFGQERTCRFRNVYETWGVPLGLGKGSITILTGKRIAIMYGIEHAHVGQV